MYSIGNTIKSRYLGGRGEQLFEESLEQNNCSRTVGDKLVTSTQDLVAPGWEKWHFAQINRLGASKYYRLSVEARKGKHPAKLFSALLRAA